MIFITSGSRPVFTNLSNFPHLIPEAILLIHWKFNNHICEVSYENYFVFFNENSIFFKQNEIMCNINPLEILFLEELTYVHCKLLHFY